MDRNPNERIDVDGHPEDADRALHMQPGQLEDIENATAYANRTGQHDVTGERADRSHHQERIDAGEDIGHGLRAQPADRLESADGRIYRGEDIGRGIRADPADGFGYHEGKIERGEDIGHGIRARRADEQDPGNPFV